MSQMGGRAVGLAVNSQAEMFTDRLNDALRRARQAADSAPAKGTDTPPAPQQAAEPPTADSNGDSRVEEMKFARPVGAGAHIVREGECIASIANEAGHFWEVLWNDPANRELREKRQNPNVLLPGDRVHVPPLRRRDEPGQTLVRHHFRRLGEPSRIHLRVLRRDGQPRAQEPYELRIDTAAWTGTTDADGWISVPISGNARSGNLAVGPPGDQARYRLALGGVDPIDSISGVQQRLTNLGFPTGPFDGLLGPATRTALLRFQKHAGLPETGAPDEATRTRLLERHCS